MKTCSACGESKPLAKFYKDTGNAGGLRYNCKQCHSVNVKRRRQTPEGKAVAVRNAQKHRTRYPLRYKARRAIISSVKSGRLVPQPCEVCSVEKTEAHHDDYTKPLKVRWLCREHHQMLHTNLTQTTNPL